jgi:predicted metal-dependent phosphoesterase TrpH
MLLKSPKEYIDLVGKVVITRPSGHLLKRLGFTGVDMHSHSHFSDGDASVNTLLKLARLRGIGFSITDHNEIKGSVLASKDKKSFVVPGIEVCSKEGREFLMYFNGVRDLEGFYSKYVKGKAMAKQPWLEWHALKYSERELIEGANDFGGLISLPHPFHPLYDTPKKSIYRLFEKEDRIFKKVHGIEVLNSLISHERNTSAFYWAKNSGKAYVGGSDSHTRFALGRVVTVTHGVEKVEDFLEMIKRRRSGVVGKDIPFVGKVKNVFSSIWNLYVRGAK